MSIVQNRGIKMANLCVVGSHSVNGVSKLHSKIIQDDLFHLFYGVWPEKFTNVTNGIASRRWLLQANPRLTKFISSRIGEGYLKDFSQLSRLKAFADDPDSLKELAQVKRENKLSFSKFVQKQYGIALNPDSIFDAQVKRLHEYKRQHLNALHILYLMKKLRENPDLDLVPPHVYLRRQGPRRGTIWRNRLSRLICVLQKEIENDPLLRAKAPDCLPGGLSGHSVGAFDPCLRCIRADFLGGDRGFRYGQYEAHAGRRHHAWHL